MNELLIAFLLLLISALTVFIIVGIMKLDTKIIQINDKISKFKNIDFANLQKIVAVLRIINKNIRLGKLKDLLEIIKTIVIIANIYIIFKKLSDRKTKKSVS